MKKTIKHIGLGLMATVSLAACSDQFLEDKTNFEKVGESVYSDYDGANARLNDIYQLCLPNVNNGLAWNNPSNGSPDIAGQSTEEYSGFSIFVNPEETMTVDGAGGERVPDFIDNENKVRENPYGHIRDINTIIEGVSRGSLSQEQKEEILGQAYFFRAWRYFNLFKWYGGVPIVTEVLDPLPENTTAPSNAKAVYEQIVSDLDLSAELLKAKTANGGWESGEWGRVTAGTALALKGRVMLWWCSPIFNRANDQSRWTAAYEAMKADLDIINACGYHLYSAGGVNGNDFAAQFLQRGKNPEAVFVTLYNNQVGNGTNTQRNSNWERYIRPVNTTGTPSYEASAMLVDMFPMKDGRIPASAANHYYKLAAANPSSFTDDIYNYPFMNRDPRFYHTFAFPGVRWAFDGNASAKNSHYTSSGSNYELWNYFWYTSPDEQGDINGKSYAADYLQDSGRGIYVRKKSDDKDVNASPFYSFNTNDISGFQYSAAPYIELRYAEVLLNLAEVACGAGDNAAAQGYLQQVRDRAGVPAYDNLSGEGVLMSAILYERQVELAYEGKRFDDLRRWLLYDGGTKFNEVPGGAPATWKLEGWGGNTCLWLGVQPLNEQRRDKMQFRLVDDYGLGDNTDPTIDPLDHYTGSNPDLGQGRCAALDYRATATSSLDDQIAVLQDWYSKNLTRKRTLGDGRSSDGLKTELKINFRPQYYLIGLASRAQNENKHLPQYVGWEDYNNRGTYGTFDPLAE